MAQLSPTLFRATDANNVPVSGAGLFVYETGTTTKQTLYSDADLTITRANPLVSGATGYWAQFYTASGVTLDLQARATSDVGSALLWQALEVDSVGQEDNGTFARDFGGNGRLSAVGASGAVRLQFGPPTGVDIGGAAVISGQNGTDLDSGVWRGPLEVTGNETVGGNSHTEGNITTDGVSDFVQLLTSGTVPAATSFVIPLDADYNQYRILIDGVATLASGATISLVLSFDGGSTYKTASGSYEGETAFLAASTPGLTGNDTNINLSSAGAVLAASYDLSIHSRTGAETVVGGTGRRTLQVTFGTEASFPTGTSQTSLLVKATHVKIQSDVAFTTGRYGVFGYPGI